MFDDLRLAVKGLSGAPGFALTVIVTLALGSGANALIFSLLFGVRPIDPVPYVAAAVLIVAVAAIAIAGPARRAARIDPAAALNRGGS